MNEQHLQATFQLSHLAATQALNLLCQVFPIESFCAPSPQRLGLFQRPRIVVAFIKILASFRPGTSTTWCAIGLFPFLAVENGGALAREILITTRLSFIS